MSWNNIVTNPWGAASLLSKKPLTWMVSFNWGALHFSLCMPIGARTQWLDALSRVVPYRNPCVHCRSSCILFPALSSGLNFYVSFQTRCDIKNGTILQLAVSPVNASSHAFFSVAIIIWLAVSCLRFSFSLHCTVRCTLLFSFLVVVSFLWMLCPLTGLSVINFTLLLHFLD